MRWMSASSRRGRPPLTSREAILDAVLEIGLDRATTAAVAGRLGVDQSTLYRHVESRDDMLDAAVARAAERVTWPEPAEDWAEYLRDCARALWTLFSTTPGLAERLRGMTAMPEPLARQAYRAVEHLVRSLDLPVREAILVVDTVGDTTADSFLTVSALHRPVDGARSFRDVVLAASEALVPLDGDARVQEYLDVLHDAMGTPDAPSTWWLAKVDLVIDGLRYRLRRAGS